MNHSVTELTERPRSDRTTYSSVAILSAITSFACVLSLFVWSATDASFRNAAWMAKVNLGIERIESNAPEVDEVFGLTRRIIESVNQWDSLGKRIAAFYLLNLVGLAATMTLLVSFVRHRERLKIVLLAAVVASWSIGLFVRTPTHYWLVKRQVSEILPDFELAAENLRQEWPTEVKVIPPGIKVLVDAEKYPNALVVRHVKGYPVRNSFGHTIERTNDGVIRFSLSAAYEYAIEFHPEGSLPTSYTSGFGNPSPPPASFTKLKNNWFLVSYGDS